MTGPLGIDAINTARAKLAEADASLAVAADAVRTLAEREAALKAHNETLMDEVADLRAEVARLEALLEQEPPTPRGVWMVINVGSAGLSIRSEPVIDDNRIGKLAQGDEVEELETRGDWIRHRGGPVEGWSARIYKGVEYLHRKGDVDSGAEPADPADDPGNQVPPLGEPWLGHAENLVGVDGPADNAEWPWLLPLPDTPGVPSLWERIAPFRALKIHEPGTTPWVINRLLAMRRPDGAPQFHFTPVRVRHPYYEPLSAHDYARQVAAPVLDTYALRQGEGMELDGPLLHYTFWNEPNTRPHHAPEGLGVAWNDVHEFVGYAVEVYRFIRANYPMVYILLPAPSPGYGIPEYNLWRDTMLRDIPSDLYDGMEGHYYWDGPATLAGEAKRAAADAAALGPGKLFVVGECANVIDGVSKVDKGRQLVRFVRAIKAEGITWLAGAFAFTLLTTNDEWKDREIDPEFSEGVSKELKGE